MKFLIGSRNFEMPQWLVVEGGEPATDMIEPQMSCRPLNANTLIYGAGENNVLSVGVGAGKTGEALSDGLLVTGVNVVCFSFVDRDDHTGVLSFLPETEHLLADAGPSFGTASGKVGKLDEVKGKVATL